jgi:hypothetical protein
MLKSLLTAELVVHAKVATQVVFTNMHSRVVSQILLANNMLLMILINHHAQLLISVKTAHGHHAQLDKPANISAGLLTSSTTMLPTITVSQVHQK